MTFTLSMLKDAAVLFVLFYIVFAIAGLQLLSGYFKYRCFDPKTGIMFP